MKRGFSLHLFQLNEQRERDYLRLLLTLVAHKHLFNLRNGVCLCVCVCFECVIKKEAMKCWETLGYICWNCMFYIVESSNVVEEGEGGPRQP